MTSSPPRPRRVDRVLQPPPMHWVGDGFPVRSLFSYHEDAAAISPFLLLDHAAPYEFPPAPGRRGVGAHPHRGFETVTIVFQGEIEHRDSAGHHGRIGPGDVQWMTAGDGVLHDEYHGRDFARRGGTFEVAQVWVNLPSRLKRTPPRYQDLLAGAMPAVELPGGAGTVRVIAGEFAGARGPARTFTDVAAWTVDLVAGAAADLALPAGHSAMVLVRRGPIVLAGEATVPEGHVALLTRDGLGFRVEAEGPAALLVLGGEPIREPVAGHGPFVMNTRAEIEAAIADFQAGRFGTLE